MIFLIEIEERTYRMASTYLSCLYSVVAKSYSKPERFDPAKGHLLRLSVAVRVTGSMLVRATYIYQRALRI